MQNALDANLMTNQERIAEAARILGRAYTRLRTRKHASRKRLIAARGKSEASHPQARNRIQTPVRRTGTRAAN